MRILVNGARLYVDIEGAGLVPDGARMRSKPVLILLHGGPGADHTIYKPAFSALTDVAQIVYVDHRGNGRSDDCSAETWTLDQWADDVKGLCDSLGIEKPIVYGASFGGFVAQAYATRYPDHPGRLILTSTAAKVDFPLMFEKFGQLGGEAAQIAAATYWSKPTLDSRAAYFRVCLPLYVARSKRQPDWVARAIIKNAVAMHFNGPHNEMGRMDFRAALANVKCPVLVMAGDADPVMPMAFSETIAACLPGHLVRMERFAGCGHGIVPDDPDRAMQVIRDFIQSGT